MKKTDLHLHSYYSDGEVSPQEILKKIIESDIFLFSITDHNYITPEISEIQGMAKKANVICLQGVEISSRDHITEKSLHILGYSEKFDIRKLNNHLKDIIEGYRRRGEKIAAKLNSKYDGLNLDVKELKGKSLYINRNVLIHRLLNFAGPERMTAKEAKKEAFIEEDNAWFPDSKAAVEMILESGGVPVLAHPGKIDGENFELLLKRLIEYGLSGIEVYYPEHNYEVIKSLRELANRYGLFVTAGSDWHGERYSSGIEAGYEMDDVEYEKILVALR